ncbi:LysE family translocator [Spiractinospora alimapuensis]|uniref:LysE family translocator n=1 Tax=Spiractinospora alimapuensis TaxID=2820884 RepID=UPI001F398B6C|nr:LysE family translocator [Spiractinospora alimapuensis]QVQ51506.1 LysE family translocator [Spiractinospora alimapuensis]
MSADISLFVGLVVVALVVPGPDFVVVSRNTIAGGRVGGLLTALGICLGLAALTTVAALGVALVVAENESVLFALRLLGGAYLGTLGALLVWKAGGEAGDVDHGSPDARHGGGFLSPVAQGFLTNVLNPKALVFYVAVMPQFLDPADSVTRQTTILGAVIIALAATWWGLFVFTLARVVPWLSRPANRTRLDRAAGFVLIAFGLWVVFVGT